MLFALTSCATLPPEFFTKDKNFSLYGLYNVSPTTGLSGLGVVTYESVQSRTDPRALEALTDRLDTLETAVKYLLQKLLESAPKSGI